MRRLAALGLLGLRLAVLLTVLRIRRGIRHISLGYDARKLGEEGVGRGAVTAVGQGWTDTGDTQCCAMAARSMIFMVSLLVFPASLERVRGLFHRTVCDGAEIGFPPLRNNRAVRHMVYAHSEAETVTEAIDTKPRAAAQDVA